jgi:hypothetical protein
VSRDDGAVAGATASSPRRAIRRTRSSERRHASGQIRLYGDTHVMMMMGDHDPLHLGTVDEMATT